MALRDPVAVYNAANNLEAHLLRDALRDSGVEAYVTEDVSQVGTWALGLLPEIHKPQVWVEKQDIEHARAVLDQYERRAAELREEADGQETSTGHKVAIVCEDCGEPSSFPPGQLGSVQQCPHCGAFVDVVEGQNRVATSDQDQNPYRAPSSRPRLRSGASKHALPDPSPALFRTVGVLSLVCWAACIALDSGQIFSAEVAQVRAWNYEEAVLPFWAIDVWWWSTAIGTVVGVLGMLCFWRPSRWVIAAVELGYVLAAPLLGLCVVSAFELFLGSAAHFMFVWLVTVSFWSPLAQRFGSAPNG